MGGVLAAEVATARRLVRSVLADLDAGDRVVLAVSGGADSLALAAAAAFVSSRDGWVGEAVVVDHQLQAGSDEVAERAAAQCRDLGLAATVVAVEVHGSGGPEAAARTARYSALQAHARATGAVAILTAHTLDDQAETVLLGLARGSGPRSLSGMPAVRGLIRRPFLTMRRADTRAVCAAYGLEPWDDPHNADPTYTRTRVRHELLPLMDDVLGGGVVGALGRTATQVAQDSDALDRLAEEFWSLHRPLLPIRELARLHPAVRSRVLRQAALHAGAVPGELTAGHLNELERLVTDWHGQKQIDLPGLVHAHRDGDRLVFGVS